MSRFLHIPRIEFFPQIVQCYLMLVCTGEHFRVGTGSSVMRVDVYEQEIPL